MHPPDWADPTAPPPRSVPSGTIGADGVATSRRRAASPALGRAVNRFMSDPSSTRNAVILIVAGNLTASSSAACSCGSSIGGNPRSWRGALVHAPDDHDRRLRRCHADRPSRSSSARWSCCWASPSLSILTATITSSFIDARQADRQADEADQQRATADRLDARLEEVIERLDRLERLTRPADGSESA